MGNIASQQQLSHHVQKLPLELIAEILCEACKDYKNDVRNSIHDVGIKPIKPYFHNFHKDKLKQLTIRHEQSYDGITSNGMTTPMRLCQVSRAWRDVVCSIPELWDTMILRASNKYGKNVYYCDQELKNMKMWLIRAGRRPLSVKIEASEESFIDLENLLINELLTYSNQWRDIDLPYPGCDSEQFSTLQKIMDNPPATLQGFTCRPSALCGGYSSHQPHQPHIPLRISKTKYLTRITICDYCPITIISPFASLQHLSLYNFRGPMPLNDAVASKLSTLELPALRHLTCSLHEGKHNLKSILSLLRQSNSSHVQTLDLDLFDIDERDLLEVFRIVPNLKHFKFILKVGGNNWWNAIPDPIDRSGVLSDIVFLNALTTFYIDFRHLHFVGDKALLHRLTLPALNEFQVILPPTRTPAFFLADLKGLVIRSNCPLKILKINTNISIPIKSLQDLLKVLPDLECLHIIGQYNLGTPRGHSFQLTYAVFEVLLPGEEDEIIETYLPKLSELSLEGKLAKKFSWDYVFDALEYRCHGHDSKDVTKLRHVRIYPDEIDARDSISMLQQRANSLQEKGMDIKIQHPDLHEDQWNGVRY